MDAIFYTVTMGALAGTIVIGLIFWLCSYIHEHRQLKKEIIYLERENLQLTRTNTALRDLLYK